MAGNPRQMAEGQAPSAYGRRQRPIEAHRRPFRLRRPRNTRKRPKACQRPPLANLARPCRPTGREPSAAKRLKLRYFRTRNQATALCPDQRLGIEACEPQGGPLQRPRAYSGCVEA